MKLITALTLILLLIPAPASQQQSQDVEVFRVDTEESIELHARNKNVFPVTIELNAEYENMWPSKPLPHVDVLAAGETKKLIELSQVDKTKAWEFNTRYSYFMGNVNARHNDRYEYRLPYRLGTEHKVGQGYNGSFSHSGSIAYSVDFQMDEGTPVYASRSGIVVDLEKDFTEGGIDERYLDKANFITILHNDGTFADYSHLKVNGVNVSIGQRVRTGQLIGYSGSTGYATGPHLHFNVKRVIEDGSFITIPTRFKTQQGSVTLSEGQTYKAL